MGTFFAFTLYSGVFLICMYLIYRLFLSGEKQISLNRYILIGCYVVAFSVWPLSMMVGLVSTPKLEDCDMVHFGDIPYDRAGNPIEMLSSQLPTILLWIYMIGMTVVLMWTLISVVRLALLVRRGEKIDKGGYVLILMSDANISPFSFGRYIVISKEDDDKIETTVIAHEAAHIRHYHFLDLLFAQIVCILLWYNPAAWLIRDELGLIHEYQADADVLESGADPKQYQMLLIMKTMSNRFHTLTNSLSHSRLKARIMMMQRIQACRRVKLRVAALALAPAIAFAIVNIPAVASGLAGMKGLGLDGEYGDMLQMMTKNGWVDVPEEETVWLKLTPGGPRAYIVNGEPLKEEMVINLRKVKTFVDTPPNEEYPGGLWTIELKSKHTK